MKVCIIQPPYPLTKKQVEETFQYMLNALDACDNRVDLILLPEYANAPGIETRDELELFMKNHAELLEQAVIRAAKACHTFVAVNCVTEQQGKLRNTTRLYNASGDIVVSYDKQHLPPAETEVLAIDDAYTFRASSPCVATLAGLRIGFLTCYDIYFNEYIEHLAAKNVDIVLLSSYQRGERMDILEMQAKACAFRCNAFLLRSSYSMGQGSKTGGCSLLAAPDGQILGNLKQECGLLTFDIDPKYKHMRSNGYGQPQIKSDLFVENGRTPWVYRPGGSMVRPGENQTHYPRLCAHRGFNTVAPENTLPAFAMAIALGAEEIELDLWPSKDGEIIVCHDATVDRVTNGHGRICDLTYAEIARLNAGSLFPPHFNGLCLPRFADVLSQFARQVIMNIHIKSPGTASRYDPEPFAKINGLIDQYDCRQHVYVAGDHDVLATAAEMAPDIPRCCLANQTDGRIVDAAIEYGCRKVQFFKPYFTRQMIEKAHAMGIKCNLFFCDDADEAKKYLAWGIDTILTNDYLPLKTMLSSYLGHKDLL